MKPSCSRGKPQAEKVHVLKTIPERLDKKGQSSGNYSCRTQLLMQQTSCSALNIKQKRQSSLEKLKPKPLDFLR